MPLPLRERALLLKLFYQNGESAPKALRGFRTLKGLRQGPMTAFGLRKMIRKFEETGSFAVKPGRGRKPVAEQVVEAVATKVEEDRMANAMSVVSVRRVAQALDQPLTTVHKIVRKILHYYPYKISSLHQLLPADPHARENFALQFLARMAVDNDWPWNILWSDEAHFHLNGAVNTHNCRIWALENPHSFVQVPLHSPKVTVWCGFTSSFILGPFFFEETTPTGPETTTVTGARYASILTNSVIPALQQRQCLGSTVFMQDGAPPHIANCVKRVLRNNFPDAQVISRHFPTVWPARSPDLNPCDFWLWGMLKAQVYRGNIATLADLKDSISRCVRDISPENLRSTVEHAILRFHMISENGGQHIEHVLH